MTCPMRSSVALARCCAKTVLRVYNSSANSVTVFFFAVLALPESVRKRQKHLLLARRELTPFQEMHQAINETRIIGFRLNKTHPVAAG